MFTDLVKPTVTYPLPGMHVLRSSACRPVSGRRMLGRLTRLNWNRAVRREARRAGISRPILWISLPEMDFALGSMNEELSIYHMVDEYTGYTGLRKSDRERLVERESRLLDRVDLSIVASPELLEAKYAVGRDMVVLENGVDPTRYRMARRSDLMPSDMRSIPRPIIGYSGLIGRRLDLDLLTRLAASRKDWSIVLVGKIDRRECHSALAAFEALPNVFFLGEKAPEDVPAYVSAFDLGMLPYAINIETRHISPIKMYEYWAAGIPVVATSIPAARRHSSALCLADDSRQFIEGVEASLRNFKGSDRERLLELAEENSWQNRVDHITAVILERISKEKSRTGVPEQYVSRSSAKS